MKFNEIIQKVNIQQDESEKMINEAEKNLGLRLQTLIDYEDSNDEDASDPIKDVQKFQQLFKTTYG